MRTVARLLGPGLLTLLCGCGAGAIYTNVTTPLDLDFNETSVQTGKGSMEKGNVKHLRIYYANFRWDQNGIGSIAKRFGLETIHYADLRQFNVLGIWRQTYVEVYGE